MAVNAGSIYADAVLRDRMTMPASRISGVLGGLGAKMGPVGIAASALATGVAAAGGALIAAGAKAAKASLDFQRIGNELDAVSGATDAQSQAMRNLAIQLGRETKFAVSDIAQGMAEMGRTGLAVNEIMGATPAVANLAAAGMLSMGDAGEKATNVMKAFGLQVTDLNLIGDVLAATAAQTNTTVGGLADAMGDVGVVASSMGISLEETAAALGVVADRTGDTNKAGTDLRMMLLALSAPNAAAAKTMMQLGINVRDVHGNMLPLPQIFQTVGNGLNRTGGEAEKAAAMSDLFGARQAAAARILIGANSEVVALAENLHNAGGAAQNMAEVQMKGMPGAWDRFRSAVEAAWTELGNELSPVLEDVLGDLTELVSTVAREVIPVLKRWIPIIRTLGKLILDNLMTKVRRALDVFKLFTDAAGWLADKLGIDGLAKALGEASDGLNILNPKTLKAASNEDVLTEAIENYDFAAAEAKITTGDLATSTTSLEYKLGATTVKATDLASALTEKFKPAVDVSLTSMWQLNMLLDAGSISMETFRAAVSEKSLAIAKDIHNMHIAIAAWNNQATIDLQTWADEATKPVDDMIAGWEEEWSKTMLIDIPEIHVSALDKIKGLLPSWEQFGKMTGKHFMEAMNAGMEETWGKLRAWFEKIFGKELGGLLGGLAQSVGQSFMQSFAQTVGSGLSKWLGRLLGAGGGGAGGGGGGLLSSLLGGGGGSGGFLSKLLGGSGGGGAGGGGLLSGLLGGGGAGAVGLLGKLGGGAATWGSALGAAWGGTAGGAGAGLFGLGNLAGGAGLKGLLAAVPGWGWAAAALLGIGSQTNWFGLQSKGYDDLSKKEQVGKHLQDPLGLGHRRDNPFSDQLNQGLIADATQRGDRFDVLTAFRANLAAAMQDVGASQVPLMKFAEQYDQIWASIDAGKLTTAEGLGSMEQAFGLILERAIELGDVQVFERLSVAIASTMNRAKSGVISLEAANALIGPQFALMSEAAGQFGDRGQSALRSIIDHARNLGLEFPAIAETASQTGDAMAESVKSAADKMTAAIEDYRTSSEAEINALMQEHNTNWENAERIHGERLAAMEQDVVDYREAADAEIQELHRNMELDADRLSSAVTEIFGEMAISCGTSTNDIQSAAAEDWSAIVVSCGDMTETIAGPGGHFDEIGRRWREMGDEMQDSWAGHSTMTYIVTACERAVGKVVKQFGKLQRAWDDTANVIESRGIKIGRGPSGLNRSSEQKLLADDLQRSFQPSFDSMMDEWREALKTNYFETVQVADRYRIDTLQSNEQWSWEGLFDFWQPGWRRGKPTSVTGSGYRSGTGFDYEDFGGGAWVQLHGREAVVTDEQGGNLARQLRQAVSGDQSVASRERKRLEERLEEIAYLLRSMGFSGSTWARDDALSGRAV